MAFRAGWRFRVKLRTVTYVAADCGVDAMVDPQDVSNTEGNTGGGTTATVGYATVLPGLTSCRANVRNATFDDADNPFLSPLTVKAGEYPTLRIYLAGTSSVSWYFPSFMISNVSWQGQVRGLQPCSFNGQADGLFYYPDGSG